MKRITIIINGIPTLKTAQKYTTIIPRLLTDEELIRLHSEICYLIVCHKYDKLPPEYYNKIIWDDGGTTSVIPKDPLLRANLEASKRLCWDEIVKRGIHNTFVVRFSFLTPHR